MKKALQADNVADNRYSNIASWDHALLQGNYLNASFISSPPLLSNGRSYIASQAPLPHTFPRFFQAIAKQKAALLINLTRLREGGRQKAHQYWPSTDQTGQEVDVGEGHKVVLVSEEEVSGPGPSDSSSEDDPIWHLTKRRLRILGPDLSSPHECTQLHFLSWPDHSVSAAGDYEHLLRYILSEAEGTQGAASGADGPSSPIWLHCSAGVGRTGTVIAGLMALELQRAGKLSSAEMRSEHGASTLTIDLIGHMRRARPAMVQGVKQAQMIVALVQRLAAEDQANGSA